MDNRTMKGPQGKRRAVRAYDLAAVAAIVCALLWVAIPSGRFVSVNGLYFDAAAQEFSMLRDVRWPPQPVRWWSEVEHLDRGLECHGNGFASYQETEGAAVRFAAPAWAVPCLIGSGVVRVVTWRQVRLAGWLPLRPARSEFYLELAAR
jgi:hypothetical protein